MAIETFGGGLVVAAGSVDTATAACAAQGVRASVGLTIAETRIELLDPIGEDEFFALGTLIGEAGELSISWDDETHFLVKGWDSDGAAASREIWFTIWRLPRAAVPSTPPPL